MQDFSHQQYFPDCFDWDLGSWKYAVASSSAYGKITAWYFLRWNKKGQLGFGFAGVGNPNVHGLLIERLPDAWKGP